MNKITSSVEVKRKSTNRKIKNNCVNHVTVLELKNQGFQVIVSMKSKNYDMTGYGGGDKTPFVADIDYNAKSDNEVGSVYDTSVLLKLKGFDPEKYLMLSKWRKSELHLYFFDKKKTKASFVSCKKFIKAKAKKKK